MLARKYCDHVKGKRTPIILSHHMLYGLKEGQEKMSKSDPDSALFMEDAADDLERTIVRHTVPRRLLHQVTLPLRHRHKMKEMLMPGRNLCI